MEFLKISFIILFFTVTVDGSKKKSRYDCLDDFPMFYNNTDDCNLSVSSASATLFSKNVRHYGYNFVMINLHFGNVTVRWTRCVIEAYKWVWTFNGNDGATAYLSWPVEYNVLSFGLLDSHTLRDLPIEIVHHGNCDNMMIGLPATTFGIARALANMTRKLVSDSKENMKYDSSVWCYKERILVSNEKWTMCHYALCPFESLTYRCCRWENYEKNLIICEKKRHQLKWFLPFLLGSFVYFYSPIAVFGIVGFLYRKCIPDKENRLKIGREVSVEYGTFRGLAYTYVDEQEVSNVDIDKDENVIFYNPLQFSSVFECFKSNACCLSKRYCRCFFLVACLSVLTTKLIIYKYTEREFVVESVRQGVPMGFLSMLISNITVQRSNYLYHFYGPIPAIVLFICFSLLFLCVPKDLSTFLTKGLTENTEGISISPLTSDICIKIKYGSLQYVRNVNGYKQFKMIMVSHFLMLLNIKFWRYCLIIQLARWNSLFQRKSGFLHICWILAFPLYCVMCSFELLLCILYFGVPIVFLFITCVRAYCGAVASFCSNRSTIIRVLRPVMTLLVFLILLLLLYFFSIIFIDSFVFISQILTYTYTGLFANPDFSYGYVILAITVIMYIFDSINFIHSVYDDLFVHVRDVCEKLKTENKYPGISLIHTVDEFQGIPRKLFSYVIQTTRPIRREIFVSVLKIAFIASVLSVSVLVLSDFQDFKRMSDLMQAAITLFVCLVPKIINSVCQVNETKWKIQRSLELKNAVHYYCRREMRKKTENGFKMTVVN
ncbi:uncharacterized protein LOC133197808 [Saccostrea echinata]|uniref:uncharacterized protein LOC133197808 n=1 Tax=Saccostrea echinata TaxID=191078 RepID=UPI002A83CE8B|nr:uncharacterized protein LOC133197808 [Saccostrea echinata]